MALFQPSRLVSARICGGLRFRHLADLSHLQILHHGVVALGLLERLTDAHATATSLLEVYPGGKLMGWPERAFIQWSYDDGEALTLELRAADAHGTLTYASVDLERASKILHSLFEMVGGVDTRLEPRPAFHVGLDEVYAS